MSNDTFSKTVNRGCPTERSVWTRKVSGRDWVVLWHSERGIFVRLVCEGYTEIECHDVIPFLQAFEPK
jgi:hypothetical protein